MAEFFGKNSEYGSSPYHNAVRKGNQPPKRRPSNPLNYHGYSNCCGLAATGDEDMPITDLPTEALPPVLPKVHSMQAWQYAKMGLALIGAYVAIKFLYGKFVK